MPGLDDFNVDAAAQNLASVGGAPLPDTGPVIPAPPPEPAPIAGPPAPPQDPTLPANQPLPAPATPELPPPGTPLGDDPVADFTQAEAAREKAQAEADKAAAKEAEEDAARKQHQADELRRQQAERDEQEAALNHTRERLAAAAEQAEQQTANHRFHDYMSTRTAAQKNWILAGAFLSGFGHSQSMNILDRAISRDFEQQKAELASKENLARLKREGVRDFDGYMRDQRLVLDHKEERARLALAAEMEAEAARSNNPVVQAKAQVAAAKLRQDASVKIGEMRLTAAKAYETNALARIKLAKAKGGGGAGTSAVQDQLMQMAAQGGDNRENRLAMGRFAVKNGVKDAPGAVKKIFDDLLKKPKGEEFDEKTIVRDVGGNAVGAAPSARQVVQLEKELRTLPRAIEQLQRLRDKKWASTRDPDFHAAVLAVAATTSAGSTDANVTHEKGTLTNSIGLPSNDAIDTKIAELQEQLQNAKNQLNPLPDGYADKKKASAKSEGGNTGQTGGKSGGAKESAVGATRTLSDGTVVRKIGPNNWQPVAK